MRIKEAVIGALSVIFVLVFLAGIYSVDRYFKLRPIRKMETRIEVLEFRVKTLEKTIKMESD